MIREFEHDIDLISAFRNGMESAFDEVFNKYYKAAYFYSFKLVKEKMAAEDIVTDSFIKLWERREQINNETGLRGYLYTTVYNASLRWLERQKTKTKVYQLYNSGDAKSDQSYFENFVRAETLRQVMEAMDKLPNECRKVFVKLFVEGKSVNETADELDVAVSTVKNQKARGIKLLRAKLT